MQWGRDYLLKKHFMWCTWANDFQNCSKGDSMKIRSCEIFIDGNSQQPRNTLKKKRKRFSNGDENEKHIQTDVNKQVQAAQWCCWFWTDDESKAYPVFRKKQLYHIPFSAQSPFVINSCMFYPSIECLCCLQHEIKFGSAGLGQLLLKMSQTQHF